MDSIKTASSEELDRVFWRFLNPVVWDVIVGTDVPCSRCGILQQPGEFCKVLDEGVPGYKGPRIGLCPSCTIRDYPDQVLPDEDDE